LIYFHFLLQEKNPFDVTKLTGKEIIFKVTKCLKVIDESSAIDKNKSFIEFTSKIDKKKETIF